MSTYKLINPKIEGNLSTSFKASDSQEAAEHAWSALSKYVTNSVPQFAFTLENSKNGRLSHFVVKETLLGEGSAKWNISELNIKMNGDKAKQFMKRIGNAKMDGGQSKDDDSSSSSSDEAFSMLKLYKNKNKIQPINYWWYDPWVYNLQSVYIPTFVAPLNPYIEIYTISYYP